MIQNFKVGHTYDVTANFEGLRDPDTGELPIYRVTVKKIADRDSVVIGYIEGDYISRGSRGMIL